MFAPSLRGHEELRQRLVERVSSGRMVGSLLFTGPEGIGKRRCALELAQRELCFRRTACGECAGCRPFLEDPLPTELPNLLRIAPEGKAGLIRIGVIREDDLVEGGVIRWAHQAPPPRCHRWILIEEAHRLNGASANMLLKTLEEPPEGTHFLLVTHRPEAVLQTIRSRCERLAFLPLGSEAVWEIAASAGWEEGERARWLAVSGGTLRFLDRASFDRVVQEVEAWLDLALGRPFGEVASRLLPDKSSSRAQSEQMSQCLESLIRVLADVARLQAGKALELEPWRGPLTVLAGRGKDLRRTGEAALGLARHLVRNPNAEALLREVAATL